MTKTGPSDPAGTTAIINGIPYYIIGDTRIKIIEHFPAEGKPVNELITNLILRKSRENAGKTA